MKTLTRTAETAEETIEEMIEKTIVAIVVIVVIVAEIAMIVVEIAMIEAEEMIVGETEKTIEMSNEEIDATVVTEMTAEEDHHHQANASGVEKQVIGKNNHLRETWGEWLICIDII